MEPVKRLGHKGRGKWLNRLTEQHKAAICEAYRQMKSINRVERHLRKIMGHGPSHTVITRVLKENGVELNPVGWPPQIQVKGKLCQLPMSSSSTETPTLALSATLD